MTTTTTNTNEGNILLDDGYDHLSSWLFSKVLIVTHILWFIGIIFIGLCLFLLFIFPFIEWLRTQIVVRTNGQDMYKNTIMNSLRLYHSDVTNLPTILQLPSNISPIIYFDDFQIPEYITIFLISFIISVFIYILICYLSDDNLIMRNDASNKKQFSWAFVKSYFVTCLFPIGWLSQHISIFNFFVYFIIVFYCVKTIWYFIKIKLLPKRGGVVETKTVVNNDVTTTTSLLQNMIPNDDNTTK